MAETRQTPAKAVLYLQELRAPFFTASIVPILVGTSLAFLHTGTWGWTMFLLALAGTVLIHAGANVINDYFDHLNGNDEANVDFVRPFTGGSRMIQNGLLTPREVLGLSLVCFALGSAIGLYLVARAGLVILILGIAGVLGGALYVAPRVSLVSHGIGEIVIGLNFGVLPVIGAYFVQTGEIRWEALLVSLPVAVLVAAILFINEFQDYRADMAVGKRGWVVRLGRRRSATVYAILILVWTVPIVVGVAVKALPLLCLAGLLPVLVAAKAIPTATRHYDSPSDLTPANGMTIVCHLSVGLLLTTALVIAGWN